MMEVEFCLLGAFLVSSFYHLFVFLGRREDLSNLAYFCAGVTLSLLLLASKIIEYHDPRINNLHITIISFFLPVSFTFFFSTVFNFKHLYRYFIIGLSVQLIAAVFCSLMYFLSTTGGILFRQIYNLTALLYILLTISVVSPAIVINKQYKKPKEIFVLIGFTPILISFILMALLPTLGIQYKTIYIYWTFLIMMGMFSFALTHEFNNEHKALKKLKRTLEQKVKERTSELAQANEDLKKAEQLKTRYFIDFAHEARTPMIIIKGYIDKISKQIKNNDDIKFLKRGIYGLTRIITNFLDIEKIFNNSPLYCHENILNMSDSLSKLIPLFFELTGKKDISLNYTISDNLYSIIHPVAFERIVYNIVFNAIKYTNTNGNIEICLHENEEYIDLIIEDNGIGMDNKRLELIQKPYFYSALQNKRNIDGMGVGLNLVRGLLDEIGGSMCIESALNAGSTFTIKLKKHIKHVSDIVTIGKQLQTDEYDAILSEDEIRLQEYYPHKKTLLIVDDNLETIQFLVGALNDEFNIYFALNGKKALDKIDHICLPDIILSDVMMDEMDGYEFRMKLLDNNKYKSIPFIFLTSMVSEKERTRAFSSGAVDFISKPFSIKELKEKIKAILKFSESLKPQDELLNKTANMLIESITRQMRKAEKITQDQKQPSIMIVDDDPQSIFLTKRIIPDNVTIYEAWSAEEALKFLTRENIIPNLIITDIRMPGLNGYELLSKLKKDSRYKNTKVAMMSAAHIGIEEKTAAFNNGVDEFFSKPVNNSEFQKKIHNLLGFSSSLKCRCKNIYEFGERYDLLERHIGILNNLDNSITYKEIGDILGKSEKTINNNMQEIYKRLGIKSRNNLLKKMRMEIAVG